MNKSNNAITNAVEAARRFFRLAEVAAMFGGFWVSAGGGTARVVAGEIARATGASFEEALRCLEEAGQEWAGHLDLDWYEVLATISGGGGRFDARTIARAACRPSPSTAAR